MSELNIGNIIVNDEVEITPVEIDIEKIYPETENLEITPKFEEQVFNHPESYGYDNVKVKPVVMTEIEITPSNQVQSYTGIFNKVTVETDANLVPENIRKDVNIFGVTGVGEIINSEINDCSYMFYNKARLNQLNDILSLCKNVTNMASMFQNCSSGLSDLDLSSFDVSKVTNMSNCFSNCQGLNNLNLKNWDTSSVTNMNSMFSLTQYVKYNDTLKHFNTENVTNMYGMFQNCNNYLTWIDLSGWNTSKVTNMSYMFGWCANLKEVNISGFTTESLTNNSSMFSGCSKLEKLVIDSPSIFKITSTDALSGTAIANGAGYVYVPDNLVEEYKSATNWSAFADQIKPLSELEV